MFRALRLRTCGRLRILYAHSWCSSLARGVWPLLLAPRLARAIGKKDHCSLMLHLWSPIRQSLDTVSSINLDLQGPLLVLVDMIIVEDSPLLQAAKPHGTVSFPLRKWLLSETSTRRWLGKPLLYLLPVVMRALPKNRVATHDTRQCADVMPYT